MRSSSIPSRRVIVPTFLLLLIVLSLLNSRYCGYARVLAYPVKLLLAPAQHISRKAVQVRQTFFQPSHDLETLQKIWVRIQSEYVYVAPLKEELKRLNLENQMLRNLRVQLEQVNEDPKEYKFPASVVAGPIDPASHTLQINRGSQSGLAVGQPVIYGASLIGRLTQVGPMIASVQLITAPKTRLNAVITNEFMPLMELVEGQLSICQLEASGTNQFLSVVPKHIPVHKGQFVRLLDKDWHSSVQGMLIGKITDVHDYEKDPLARNEIVVDVQSLHNLRYMGQVTVIVPPVKNATSTGGTD